MMSQPYITDRATLKTWADDGDTRAAEFLSYPNAVLFGIDDDDVQVWFASEEQANTWLADMQADAAEQRANRT